MATSCVALAAVSFITGLTLNSVTTDVPTLHVVGYASITSVVGALTAIAVYGFQRKALMVAAFILVFVTVVAATESFTSSGGDLFALTETVAFLLPQVGVAAGIVVGAVAMVVTIAGLLHKTGLIIGIVMVTLGSSIAFTSDGALNGAETVPVRFSLVVSVAMFQIYAIYQVWRKDDRFASMKEFSVQLCALFGTRFDGADLTGASFVEAELAGAHFRNANLFRAKWRSAKGLDECVFDSDSILKQSVVRELLTTGNGRNRSYVRIDLHGADLENVNFTDANLREANCVGAMFKGATLTGACIEAWNIDISTNLEGVDCRYVFLKEQADEKGGRKRRPADPARTFESGEFAKLYTKAIHQMEILLKNRLPPSAIGKTIREFQYLHPDVRVTKVEDLGEDILLGLELPLGTDELVLDRDMVRLWKQRCHLLEQHNRDLAKILQTPRINIQQSGGVMTSKIVQDVSIQNSQVASLINDDVSQNTQTFTQSDGDSAVLAEALDRLTAAVTESKAITAPEKLEATQQIATVAKAAESPKDADWKAAAGKALDRLSALLAKAPDLVKLVEVTHKAWESVAKGIGL